MDLAFWLVFVVGVVHSVAWSTRILAYLVARACWYQPLIQRHRDRFGDVMAGLLGVCAAGFLYVLLLLVEIGG